MWLLKCSGGLVRSFFSVRGSVVAAGPVTVARMTGKVDGVLDCYLVCGVVCGAKKIRVVIQR
jgi:hypothetical protein